MGTAYLEDMPVAMLGLGLNMRARERQWPCAHVPLAWCLGKDRGVCSICSDASFAGTVIPDTNLMFHMLGRA